MILLVLGALRRRAALRRRHDHAGDLGAQRGRRARASRTPVSSRSSFRSRSSFSSVCSSSSGGARPGRRGLRTGHARVVRRARRARRLPQIVAEPESSAAINPRHAVRFFIANGMLGFLVLGAVLLADHRRRSALRRHGALRRDGRSGVAWFVVVLPALLLNYFGQGALLLREPAAVENPFYLLAPSWALYPLVVSRRSRPSSRRRR